MGRLPLCVVGLVMGFAVWATHKAGGVASPACAQPAQQSRESLYDSNGALLRPQDFETWVFVGSSTGLTYEGGIRDKGAGEFHDVYMRPESYREYLRTGKFPEQTVLVLALHPAEDKVSPAKGGYFEGELQGMAVAVKDHRRFPEGWAYFSFGEGLPLKDQARTNPRQMCFACHKRHAADDNVFVQFYPVLRPIRKAHSSAAQR